tara:strand:- start:40 stop:540 length:501 start_codon:yes stop_codon:yes gene_type:complete
MTIVENFLPENLFKLVEGSIIDNENHPWYRSGCNENQYKPEHEKNKNDMYFTHLVFQHCEVRSQSLFTLLKPLIDQLPEFRALIRIKCNYYLPKDTVWEHTPHFDYPFPHKAAVLSLNTCDGYTRIGDQKIDSIKNRILFFNGNDLHNSTSTTDPKGRFNININYV